jgi:hypothetical protein
MEVCFDNYLEAIQGDEMEAESAANIVALCFLLMAYTQTVPELLRNRTAVLNVC